MTKKTRILDKPLATKSDLRQLRASVDSALEQIVMTNAIALTRTLKMVGELEQRVRRVKKASKSK